MVKLQVPAEHRNEIGLYTAKLKGYSTKHGEVKLAETNPISIKLEDETITLKFKVLDGEFQGIKEKNGNVYPGLKGTKVTLRIKEKKSISGANEKEGKKFVRECNNSGIVEIEVPKKYLNTLFLYKTEYPDYESTSGNILVARNFSMDITMRYPLRYAGFWKRYIADCIDLVILGILITSRSIFNLGHNSLSITIFLIAVIALFLIYFIWSESSIRQATFGKILVGIVVTDLEGRRISIFKSIERLMVKYLCSIVIGFMATFLILSGFNPLNGKAAFSFAGFLIAILAGLAIFLIPTAFNKKQAPHDSLTDCLVLSKARRKFE